MPDDTVIGRYAHLSNIPRVVFESPAYTYHERPVGGYRVTRATPPEVRA